MSAVEVFEQFIDTEIIKFVVNESRRYVMFLKSRSKNYSWRHSFFFAILFVTLTPNLQRDTIETHMMISVMHCLPVNEH